MAKVYAFVNQKGGVGKTTSAINVASFLALDGFRVLLVDSDPQANSTSGIGIDPRKLEKGVYDVIIGQQAMADTLFQSPVERLHIVPATIALAGASVELVNVERREYRLQQAIQTVLPYYDYIIIDCPPSLELLTVNALVATHEVIIPVQCEYYALEGLTQLLNTIKLIQENLHPKLTVKGVVLTMFDKRNKLSQEIVNEIKKNLPHKIFNTIIPRNVKLAEAPSYGKPIVFYDSWSKGSRAYRQLTDEIKQ
ncbi:MAG: ParA family protein [Patescibacteria group bacterium]|jgi:chromosome partitioning protein